MIARLIDGTPKVIATGGGAFINDETRALILDTGAGGLARRGARQCWSSAFGGATPAPCCATAIRARCSSELAQGPQSDLCAGADSRVEQPRAARRDRQRDPEGPRSMTNIPVALGARSYDVLIEAGLLRRAGEFLAPLARGRPHGDRHRRECRRAPGDASVGARRGRRGKRADRAARRARAPRAGPARSADRPAARSRRRARRPCHRAGRRRDRRSGRLRVPRSSSAAAASCRSRPRCSPRSIRRSAARPRSTAAPARI